MIALVAGAFAHAQSYSVKDLGVPPGEQMSTGSGLNSKGQAVGISADANGENGVATLFSGGTATSLGRFGANDDTFAEGISNSGLVTGYICNNSAEVSNVFLYSGGHMTDIADASLFPDGSDGTGVNNSGVVCGYGWPTTVATHAFVYSNGVTTDLGTMGGSESVAEAINDAGQVVGQFTNSAGNTHGFLYAGGKMTDLGVPSDSSISTAIAISSNGLIVGEIVISGVTHVAEYVNGAWTDLGSGPLPTGINSSGVVVGEGEIPGVYSGPKAKRKAAQPIGVILVNGSFVNLNTLIPAGSGFTINYALAINDSGQILCDATVAGDVTHAVLLTPQ